MHMPALFAFFRNKYTQIRPTESLSNSTSVCVSVTVVFQLKFIILQTEISKQSGSARSYRDWNNIPPLINKDCVIWENILWERWGASAKEKHSLSKLELDSGSLPL